MTYGPNDPRSRLSTAPAREAKPNAAAQYVDFASEEPDEISETGSRTWWVRGQNFALAYTQARAGETLERLGQSDEYVVLFPQAAAAAGVTAGAKSASVRGSAVVIVPSGDSRIEVDSDTAVVRLFSAASPELLARCRNNAVYAEPHANVAPFAPWPDPVHGPALRVYPVGDHPYEQGRFGRLFRCSTFMVNMFDPDFGPRDPGKLSPHQHDDFEQCSLAVDGQYIHHIRSPWTLDKADWREDEHVHLASPSVAIIPPPSVHTSQSVSQVRNHLIDIFCPPRHDFSAHPGWVINAHEYPMPDEEQQ